MRASEKREEENIRRSAMYSIVKDFHTSDPKVIETFNRPPYWPVLKLERGEEQHERKTESEEV